MKTNIMILAAAALIAGTTGCNTQKKTVTVNSVGTVQTQTPQQTEGAIEQVIFGSWAVIDVNGQRVEGPDAPYVEFAADARNPFLVKCYAYDGCNYMNGEYAVTAGGQMKSTGDFAKTMQMCPDAKYELGVTMGINNVRGYRIEKAGIDYLMYMTDSTGRALLTLRKYDSKFIDGAWAVTSINGASVAADKDLSLVIDLAEKTVHGNAGCNALNGNIVVNPSVQNSFEIQDVATTRMSCPDLALEQTFLAALNQVKKIRPTGNDTADLLSEADQTLLTLKRLAN